MANSASATFDFQDVLKALKNLPINIEKNIMVGATRAGANVVRDEAQRLVPIDTGNLRQSIGLTKRKQKNRNEIVFAISPRRLKSLQFQGLEKGNYSNKVRQLKLKKQVGGYYARWLELGTSKMNAKPFLRPALESSQDEVLQRTKEYIANRLPQEVVKARK